MKKYIVIIFYLILVLSCKKEYVVDVNQDFEGEWRNIFITEQDDSIGNYVVIDGNKGEYGEFCSIDPFGENCNSYFSGDAKFSRNKKEILIGKRSNQVVLVISESPHVNINNEWECSFDGEIFIKF